MPELPVLKAKWFIDINNTSAFPPQNRHPGSTVGSQFTDGNLVTPLIDGQIYMKKWHDLIDDMARRTPRPANGVCQVYHAGFSLDNVRTLGYSIPSSAALDVLARAHNNNVRIYIMLSRHAFNTISYTNISSRRTLSSMGISTATLDNRYPINGSAHQKMTFIKDGQTYYAIVGGGDIATKRWDTSTHLATQTEREPGMEPTHDLAMLIQGPAVADIQRSFRDRWDDSTRTFGLEPLLPSQPLIGNAIVAPASAGPHSVQVLQTYGRASIITSYSWADRGEFTIWAAYLNAIKKAQQYIYIEDQYFYPFDWPFRSDDPPSKGRDSDIIYQLGEAIKRGVKVAILVPDRGEDAVRVRQRFQRDNGIIYLRTQAAGAQPPGDLVVATLHNGAPVVVHSKLLIVDDEYVLTGSANVCQRSMAYDGELNIGIIDANNAFARELRKELWAEHLGEFPATLDDPISGFALFKSKTIGNQARVRNYVTDVSSVPFEHGLSIRHVIDPYAGPDRDGS